MEFTVKENGNGIRNLYFGHPYSKETYTNSVMLKTPVEHWEADFDGIYSGKEIALSPVGFDARGIEADLEHRVIRGTKVMFIGDYLSVLEMEEDVQLYHGLCELAMIKINNPEFMEFDAYTANVLHDPLVDINEVSSITRDVGKKYMEYAVKYNNDKRYSDRLILKPYFKSTGSGVLVLTEEFKDFNIDFDVSHELGVIGVRIRLSGNTSKYTQQYKDV